MTSHQMEHHHHGSSSEGETVVSSLSPQNKNGIARPRLSALDIFQDTFGDTTTPASSLHDLSPAKKDDVLSEQDMSAIYTTAARMTTTGRSRRVSDEPQQPLAAPPSSFPMIPAAPPGAIRSITLDYPDVLAQVTQDIQDQQSRLQEYCRKNKTTAPKRQRHSPTKSLVSHREASHSQQHSARKQQQKKAVVKPRNHNRNSKRDWWSCQQNSSNNQEQNDDYSSIPTAADAVQSFDSIFDSTTTATIPMTAMTSSVSSSHEPPLLHQSCRLYPQTVAVVGSALRMDPTGASRRWISAEEPITNASKKKQRRQQCQPQQHYTYPLNIALQHNASCDVIQLLMAAAPRVLSEPDGPQGYGSLSLAISSLHPQRWWCNDNNDDYTDNKNKKHNVNSNKYSLLDLFLVANPECVSVKDCRSNYPLHVACTKGLEVEVIRKLAQAYPAALSCKNFHGYTPLNIAQRCGLCKDDVIDFLQQAAFDALEETADHL